MSVALNSINSTPAIPERKTSEVSLPEQSVSPAVQDAPQEEEEAKATPEMMKAAAKAANDLARVFNTDIKFEVHEATHLEMMRIVDARSGAVIKEIPPSAVLDMIGKLWDTIGLVVDKKA